MAVAKTARVIGTQSIGVDTRLVDLIAAEPLGFVGGQYIIVDSGLVLPTGKAAKRAYSLLTCDAEQRRFQLAVKRIPGGLASGFMHGLEPGAEITFSGPWGKMIPQSASTGATLIIATDTGISAALGLVQSKQLEPLLDDTSLIWLRISPDYFLPEHFVRQQIPPRCSAVRIESIAAIGDPERIPYVRALLRDEMARREIARAFIAGDGHVNYALLDDLVTAGITATKDSVESFFNMPKKSAAPAAVTEHAGT